MKLNDLIDNHNLTNYISDTVNEVNNNEYYTIDSINKLNKNHIDISIFHLNIRSLNKHSAELVNLLSEIKISFDCICLSEINKTNINMFKTLLDDYVFHPIIPEHGNVGGVGIYVKQHIKLDVLNKLDLTCKNPCENLWVNLNKNKKDTIVGIIYRHPSGDIADFNEQLEKTIQEIHKLNTDRCIIIGDINRDLIKYNQPGKAKIKDYLDMMLSHGYLPRITLPSRITDHSATLIDHIFVKERNPADKSDSGNIFTDISDHFANFYLSQNANPRGHQQKQKVRIFSKKSLTNFIEILQHTQWELLYTQTDPNVCANFFNNIISHAYEKSFPLKFISNKRIKDKPWISTSLKKSIKKKNHLFYIYTKNRTIENKQKYAKYRNILISCIRQSKKMYFQELFDRKSTRITKMWAVLGKMINPKKKSQCFSIKEVISDGISYKEDSEIANALNSHFCNIGSKISSKIQNAKSHFSSFLKIPQDKSFFLEMTNVSEVISEINKLKIKKAAGHDGIKPVIIKKSCLLMAKPLTHIYNASFETGVMPNIWKIAKVIPIFQKGERCDPNNYRPISLLSCFKKNLRAPVSKADYFIPKEKQDPL